jgi:putative glutamine amidotransferase
MKMWLMTHTPGKVAVARYVEWVRREGIEPHLVGSLSDVPVDLDSFDALLLTGGGDVAPGRYGASVHPQTKSVNPERDELEICLIRSFLRVRKPVFGVCRGIQVLNVALGGKLVQHLPEFLNRQGLIEEHRKVRNSDSRHPLVFVGQSALRRVLKGRIQVNSAHHQAVDPDAIGTGLRVTARSSAGIIEAVEGQGFPSPVLAVQWHPERLDSGDPASERLLELMIKLCGSPSS